MDEFDDQIYDFGSTAYDELLSSQLDEGFMNDFNDDTFGDTATTKDFDFAGNTNRFLTATPAPAARAPSRSFNPLDHDDLLSSNRPSPPVHRRTVEEIELSQRQQAQAQRPPVKAAMTLEQVEAEMLRARQEQNFQLAQMQQQRLPPPGFYAPQPPSGPSTPQQQSQQIPNRFQAQQMNQMNQNSSPRLQQALPPPNNMLTTLFPPLPSQQAPPPTVEQQLEYLSMNQNQHPSLTGAHLQSLLHQAHNQAQLEPVAGEDLIRSVEARIREHEMLEHKRKRKAAKIASMVRDTFT